VKPPRQEAERRQVIARFKVASHDEVTDPLGELIAEQRRSLALQRPEEIHRERRRVPAPGHQPTVLASITVLGCTMI